MVNTRFCITAEASAPQFLRCAPCSRRTHLCRCHDIAQSGNLLGVRTSGTRRSLWKSGYGKIVDPGRTVSCRCLKGSRDGRVGGEKAREAPFRNSIVDLLVPPIQEHAVEAFRVFTQEYVLSACRAVYVLSCCADFERDRVAQVYPNSACSGEHGPWRVAYSAFETTPRWSC